MNLNEKLAILSTLFIKFKFSKVGFPRQFRANTQIRLEIIFFQLTLVRLVSVHL